MLTRAWLLFLFPFFLFASDFDACQKVLTKSFKIIDGNHAVYTSKGWLVFSQTPINSDAIKQQSAPLGLYLLQEGIPHDKPLKIYDRYPKDIALITPYSIRPNTIISEAYGIDRLAMLKNSISAPFPIMGACCTLRGFNAQNGVVTSDYINLFMNRPTETLFSVGVRFESQKKGIVVTAINPFIANNPFKLGDTVLFHNNKKTALRELEKSILFSMPGTIHHFNVLRSGNKVQLKARVTPRLGGGVLADTFLEHLGWTFNEKLEVVGIKAKSVMDDLKILPQDRLISLNENVLHTDEELRAYLSRFELNKEPLKFLIQRRGLQFFVYVPSSSVAIKFE